MILLFVNHKFNSFNKFFYLIIIDMNIKLSIKTYLKNELCNIYNKQLVIF